MKILDVLFVNTPSVPPLRPIGMGQPKIELALSRLQHMHRSRFFSLQQQVSYQATGMIPSNRYHTKHQVSYQVTDVGLLSLSKYLRDAGYSTGYFLPDTKNYDISNFLKIYCRELVTFLRNNEVRFLALGPYTCIYPTAQVIARIAKNVSPNTKIILGGQHATFLDSQVLTEARFVDFVVRGEGEKPLESILKASGKRNMVEAPGITYRSDRKIIRNPDAKPLPGNEIPSQDLERIPAWLRRFNIVLNIPTGRGCLWRCFFCTESAFWGKPRQRSAKKVAEEVCIASSKLRVKEVRFSDDTFAHDINYLEELTKEFRNHGIDLLTVQIWTRVDRVNNKMLKLLSRLAENVEVCYGVESACEDVLKVMRKGITIEQIIRALQKTKEYGIYSTCFWIVGHPGSSVQSEKLSTDFMCKLIDENLCSSHQVSVFQPYPGSEAFELREKVGVVIDSYEWNRYIEDPPVFPPVSHLVNFSSTEIMLAYLERRIKHYDHICKQIGIDTKSALQL